MRRVREIVKDNDSGQLYQYRDIDQIEKILRSFDKSITGLRIAMNRLCAVIEGVEENWIIHEILMEHKNMLHSQIDLLIKERRKLVDGNRSIHLR